MTDLDTLERLNDSESLLDIMIQIEDYLDNMDLYVFDNWIKGELVSGPWIKRHWIIFTLKYSYEDIPDPRGALRLAKYGTKIAYRKGKEEVPVEIESYDDYEPGTRKPKTEEKDVWFVDVKIPRKFTSRDTGDMDILMSIDDDIGDDVDNVETAEVEDDIEERDAYVEESRNYKKTRVNEGLRSKDLIGTIKPNIEIDTFESKISEDGLVVMFLADDEPPAEDLCDFIEKTHIDILDCEVSYSPNEEGEFAVFVEFIRNSNFPKKMMEIIHSVNNLVGIDQNDWNVKVHKKDGTHNLTEINLKKLVRLKKANSSLPEKE